MLRPLSNTSNRDWRVACGEAGVDERELRAACRRRGFTRREVVFHEGDPSGAVHLLETGHVAVKLTTPLGDVAIVDVLQPGDTFGEQALVDSSGERTASVVALGAVETMSIDAATFTRLFGADSLQRFLIELLGRRLGATNRQLLEARYVAAEQRMARCLGRLADQFAHTADGSIPLTQADIASMTGVTRSTANRLLRMLERDGALEIARARIRVIDRTVLGRRAGLA